MQKGVGGLEVVGGLVLSCTLSVVTAGAQCPAQSPQGCSTNRLEIPHFQPNPLVVPNGSTVTYEVELQNNPGQLPDACDVRDAFVTFCCPGADGNPVPGPAGCTNIPVTTSPCNVNGAANCVPTAEATTGIGLSATIPSPDNDRVVPGLVCLIHVNPGVTTALAEVMVHDGYLSCQGSPGSPQLALGNILAVQVLPCAGDCNGNGRVDIDDFTKAETIIVGSLPFSDCPAFDANHNARIDIDDFTAAALIAINGCP